jgi:Zn-dependent protease
MFERNIILFVETFIAFVIAVTLHESAHAAAAAALGDASPAAAGRLSLAPRSQMAAIGTIVAIVYSFGILPAGMGWGRPMDVDARRLRVGPNFGLILVALAGPLVNLVLGIGIVLALPLIPGYHQLAPAILGNCRDALPGEALQSCLSVAQPAYVLRIEQFAYTFAVSNVALALINIIPLHPLDGYKVLFALLPNRQAITYRDWEPYMELTLLVIFFVVPYILAFLNIDFNPGQIIITFARNITDPFAINIAAFYRFI